MTTLAYSIATGADDGFSVTASGTYSSTDITSTTFRTGCQSNRGTQNSYWGGTRFQGVAMPNGQVVDSADIEIYLNATTSGTANYDIYGDDLDDAPNVFSSTTPNRPGLPADVTETTAVYSHVGGSDDTTENKDVADIVTEIAARAGWVNGNDMRFAWQDTIGTNTTNFIVVAGLEHSTEPEPILNIVYTAAAAPTGTSTQTLPSLSQSATGVEEFTGTSGQTLPAITQQATGAHTVTLTGTSVQTLPSLIQAAIAAQIAYDLSAFRFRNDDGGLGAPL